MEDHKLAEIQSGAEAVEMAAAQRKPFGWGSAYWGKWAMITHAFEKLGIPEGSTVLDVGAGTGWTTVFLAELGYKATGVDIAPGHAVVGARRAERYGVEAAFVTADMDTMDVGRFDACLVFDALHHTQHQARAVERISAQLKPGAWVLFGEPSWLHGFSPRARKTSKDVGWVERGVRVSVLKRDCRKVGFGDFQRFYEGTAPTAGTGLAWQLCRLLLTPFSSSPQTSIWLAARKLVR